MNQIEKRLAALEQQRQPEQRIFVVEGDEPAPDEATESDVLIRIVWCPEPIGSELGTVAIDANDAF